MGSYVLGCFNYKGKGVLTVKCMRAVFYVVSCVFCQSGGGSGRGTWPKESELHSTFRVNIILLKLPSGSIFF